MKKQLKTTVMAIALLATVTGAFASDIANAFSGSKRIVYTWKKYNRDQTVSGTSTGTENSFAAECPGTLNPLKCAEGTSLGNPTIIRYYVP